MWLRLLLALLLATYIDANCDVCQIGKAACHSENTYSICLKGKATNDIITCRKGDICTGDKYICYPEVDHEPICKPAPIDPMAFCSNLGQVGNYRNTDDPTCKSFVMCLQNGENGPMTGYIYQCGPKKPYFLAKECQADKPAQCT